MALYPARVVKPLPVPQDLICAICTGVLLDPVDGSCQHPACRECLNQWFSKSKRKTCPTCRQPLKSSEITPAHRFIRNRLDELEVTCDNAARGCTAVVALGTLKDHVAACGKATVPCQHDGCTATVLRQDLSSHLQACPHRVDPCKHCKASIRHQDGQDHLRDKCPAVEVACQHNGVCGKRVRRDELATHINTECSLATVPCVVPGCPRKVARGALKKHLEESQVEHMTSLSAALLAANAKVVALEAEVSELKAGNGFQCVVTLHEHSSTIVKLAAADGILCSASADGTIRVWSLQHHTWLCIHNPDKENVDEVLDVAVGDGVIYGIIQTGYFEKDFCAWRASDHQMVDIPGVDWTINMAVRYKGKLYCAFYGQGVQVYNTGDSSSESLAAEFEGVGTSGVLAVGDDILYTLNPDGLIQAWSTSNYAKLHEAKCSTCNWLQLTLGNGMLYCPDAEDSIQVFSVPNLSWHSAAQVSLSENCEVLAAGAGFLFVGAYDGTIKVWSETDYSKVMTVLPGDKSPVTALLVHNGKLYSGSNDGKIKVWRIPT